MTDKSKIPIFNIELTISAIVYKAEANIVCKVESKNEKSLSKNRSTKGRIGERSV